MELLDLALRGASISVLVLLAGLLWLAPIGWEGRISIVAVAASKTAMLLLYSATPLDLPPLVIANLALLASLVPNALTWLIVTIFIDPPFRRWPWLVASSVVSALMYMHMMRPDLVGVAACAGSAMVLYGALFGLALFSARDDLVECRCRARPGFAAAIAGFGLVLTGLQATGVAPQGTLQFALVQSIGTLGVTLAFAAWILRPMSERWPGETEASPPPPESVAPQAEPALIAQINRAMARGVWREEGLTIGALAGQLQVPEHRLRRAINGGLGHRNFSSFINAARIDAAKAQLSDPEALGTTVLEVAYGVGFASLGPFNRAFRAETGQSPTEFRRQALDSPRAGSENLQPIPSNLH